MNVMMDERTIELIHLRADGTATAAETAELEELMAASPAVLEAVQTSISMIPRLETAPLVMAPAGMDDEILQRLQRPASFQSAAHRRNLRYIGIGWAAAALLVAGVAVRPLFHTVSASHAGVQPSEAAGALAPAAVPDDWPMLSRVSSRAPGGSAQMAIHRRGDQVAVELTFQRPDSTAPFLLQWDPRKLALSDASSRQGDQFDRIDSGEASLSPAGQGHRLLYFKRSQGASGKTDISVSVSGSKILSSSITIE